MVRVEGVGFTRVGELWERTAEDLLVEAIEQCLEDANVNRESVDTVLLLRPLSPHVSVSDMKRVLCSLLPAARVISVDCGTNGIEALSLACELSSAGRRVLMAAVEKLGDLTSYDQSSVRMRALGEHFRLMGIPAESIHALMARLYLRRFGVDRRVLAEFVSIVHAHAVSARHARFRFRVRPESVLSSPIVSDPLRLFDFSSLSDGSAALMLSDGKSGVVVRQCETSHSAAVVVEDASLATLERAANRLARGKADFYELYDESSILALLELEALGVCERGRAADLVTKGAIRLSGEVPVCTFGGLKARGDVGSANTLYQIAEATLQLRGEAGENQVENARRGVVVSLHGIGLSAGVCVLERV